MEIADRHYYPHSWKSANMCLYLVEIIKSENKDLWKSFYKPADLS